MPERPWNWCKYEVRDMPGHPRCIQENGQWPTGGMRSRFADDGVVFDKRGPNAILWALRDGAPYVVALRIDDEVSVPGVIIPEMEETENFFRIKADNPYVLPGDGFVELPHGVRCEAAGFDYTEGRPRPRVYVS